MKSLYLSIEKIISYLSRTINYAIFLGEPTETLSARSYRQRDKLLFRVLRNMINLLFFWQDDHCKMIYTWENPEDCICN